MRRASSILLLALAATLIAQSAIAAAFGGIAIELNRSRRIVLPGTPANISVADATIADVTVIDTHSVVVIGKSFGVTDIMVSDHSGRLLMNARVAVVPPELQRVTVYRGVTPTEYSCMNRCQGDASGAGANTSASAETANAAGAAQPSVTASPVNPH